METEEKSKFIVKKKNPDSQMKVNISSDKSYRSTCANGGR